MERRAFIALIGMAAAALPSRASAGSVHPPDSLAARVIGTWRFVESIDTRKDGSTFNRWGDHGHGVLMLDGKGHFSQIIVGSESRVFGVKTFSMFGVFSIDEAEQVLLTHVDGCSVSKLAGVTQRRLIISATAEELRYVNPTTIGGTKAEVKWTRLA